VGLVLAVAAVVLLLAVYASWTARRLDRLHARVDAAATALDEQLRVRAAAASDAVRLTTLPRAIASELDRAAADAGGTAGLGHDREVAESALSRALQDASQALDVGGRAPAALADAATRASFARRFHNDAVRDALVVRRRWVVRLLHLAGHAARPEFFEIDDSVLANSDVAAAAAPYD
jgi:hypothetical protein